MTPLQKESEWEKMTHKDWFPVVGGGPECENCGAHGYEKYDICPVAVKAPKEDSSYVIGLETAVQIVNEEIYNRNSY